MGFTADDIKSGMVIETKDERLYVVLESNYKGQSVLVMYNIGTKMFFDSYDPFRFFYGDDLTPNHPMYSEILRIYYPKGQTLIKIIQGKIHPARTDRAFCPIVYDTISE